MEYLRNSWYLLLTFSTTKFVIFRILCILCIFSILTHFSLLLLFLSHPHLQHLSLPGI